MSARRDRAPCPALAVAFAVGLASPASAGAAGCPVPAAPGTNPSAEAMAAWMGLVARGRLDPRWDESLPRPLALTSGCERPAKVPAFVPCEVLHGIAETESNHQQFRNGRTVISHDCGYGLTQVTSGMRGGAGFDPARVASDGLYNLATGALILTQKWAIRHCVGERRPQTIEHWYRALWAYNGLSYINNPTNPLYSAVRGVWNPKTESRRRPYQELVFGYIEHPPGGRFRGVPLAYPDLLQMVPSELVASGRPRWPEPSCASPTDCINRRSTHVSACATTGSDAVWVAAALAGDTAPPSAATSADAPSPEANAPSGGAASAASQAPSLPGAPSTTIAPSATAAPSATGAGGDAALAFPARSPRDRAAAGCDRCALRAQPSRPSGLAWLVWAAASALAVQRRAARRR